MILSFEPTVLSQIWNSNPMAFFLTCIPYMTPWHFSLLEKYVEFRKCSKKLWYLFCKKASKPNQPVSFLYCKMVTYICLFYIPAVLISKITRLKGHRNGFEAHRMKNSGPNSLTNKKNDPTYCTLVWYCC